jgi:hypothetical protein
MQAASLAHLLRGIFDRAAQRQQLRHLGAGEQRLKQRHPAADQDGERARKPRGIGSLDDRPENRQPQQPGVPLGAHRLARIKRPRKQRGRDQRAA